jgi:hypothetical protein
VEVRWAEGGLNGLRKKDFATVLMAVDSQTMQAVTKQTANDQSNQELLMCDDHKSD